MRILIAEDEAIVARDLQAILENFGHTVIGIVDTAEDIVPMVTARHPELALLDIHLYGNMDGIEVGKVLHDQFELPIIYLTAHGDSETIRRGMLTSPLGYLVKPFDEQTLRATLEVAYHQYQLEQQIKVSKQSVEATNTQLNTTIALLKQQSVLTTTLLHCTTVEQCYAAIAEAAQHMFLESTGTLYMWVLNSRIFEKVASWGTRPVPDIRFQPELCPALRDSQFPYIEYSQIFHACICTMLDPHFQTLCVPLVIDNTINGMLQVSFPLSIHPEGSSVTVNMTHIEMAATLMAQAALGLDSVRMRIALREQSIRDPLTGLFNRRYLEETLTREQHRAARNHHPIGIIILDIDHFKHVNDQCGHAAGDTVLRALSELLLSVVRTEDVVCRYGGEEFVIVMPSATEEVTFARAEMIRHQVEMLQLYFDGRPLPAITISLGLTNVPDGSISAYDAIRQADAALYQAKQAGRNRTMVAMVSPIERHCGANGEIHQ